MVSAWYIVLKAWMVDLSPTTNLFTSFLLQRLESAVQAQRQSERTPSTCSSDFKTSCFTKTCEDTDAGGISASGGFKFLKVNLKDRDGTLYLDASHFPSNAMVSSLFRLDCKANGVEIFFSQNWILLWTEALTQNLILAEALIHAFCWLARLSVNKTIAYAKDWTKPVNIVKSKEMAWCNSISFR